MELPHPDADALYDLPLERFVPARQELAKRLRDEGERVAAAEVAKLPKPSAAAWVVNRLARVERDRVAELLRAGDRLREAQEAALGGRGAELRAAAAAHRDAVARLVAAAERSGGRPPSEPVLERVRETLLATAADRDLAEAVRDGRLVKEASPGTLGWGPVPETLPEPPPKPPKRDVRHEERDAAAAERKRQRAEAARAVERKRNELTKLEQRAGGASERLRLAEAELAAAREAEEDARAAAERAREELAAAEEALPEPED